VESGNEKRENGTITIGSGWQGVAHLLEKERYPDNYAQEESRAEQPLTGRIYVD